MANIDVVHCVNSNKQQVDCLNDLRHQCISFQKIVLNKFVVFDENA